MSVNYLWLVSSCDDKKLTKTHDNSNWREITRFHLHAFCATE